MVHLTFHHANDIFTGYNLSLWVKRLFPKGVKYEGCKTGFYKPTICVDLEDFQECMQLLPTKNLIRIRGDFSIIEQLVYGVRNFDNEIKLTN